MKTSTVGTQGRTFGCDDFGRLTQVFLHRPPEAALKLINRRNYRQWLFDAVPDVGRFIEEHDRWREMLRSHGVEVFEIGQFVQGNADLLEQLPNLVYLHDIAVVSSQGVILSAMASDARRGEESVVREALTNWGAPILIEFDPSQDAFEGCLLLSPKTLLVAETERHDPRSVEKFIAAALGSFSEVIYARIPRQRRYMHPDTIYNRVAHNLALAYLPAFKAARLHTRGGVKEIDFARHMGQRGVEIVNVSDSEQQRLACSFVPLEPGVIFHYDTALDAQTQAALRAKGVELILFHPQAMVAGGGSLRCITLRLHRQGEQKGS